MSINLDKNPHKKGGEWHIYKVNLSAIDGEKGKEIEVQMMEGEDLDLYGLMTLENAAKVHKALGEKLKEFGDYEREIVKNLVMERLRASPRPVYLTTLEHDSIVQKGIRRTQTFAAITELYKKDKKIKEVIIDNRYTAYEPVKSS